MATAYKLTACNSYYPDITPVLTNLTAWVGETIILAANPTQSYVVSVLADTTGTVTIDPDDITIVPACVACVPFNAHVSLTNDECSCGSIVITDDADYVNSIAGHDVWGYRKVVLSKPNGGEYIWSSESSENPDAAITAWSNVSVNSWTYNFESTDVDGLYDVKIYSFPTWQSGVMYNSLLGVIVYRNGALYKIKTTNVGEDPELDTDEIYWEAYTISDTTMTTRYAYEEKIVVLCISLLKCKEGLIRDAYCTTESSPCGDLCSNKKAQAALKFAITEMAIGISKCAKDWSTVEKQIEILKSLCHCGGGC